MAPMPEPEPPPEAEQGVAAGDAAGDPAGPAGEAAPAVAPKDLGLLKEVLEALIFVHRGILPPKTVREVLGEEFTAEEIAAGFAALRRDYEERGGALTLVEVAGGYQFGTRADLAPWIKKLDFYEHHRHLSRPTMETLAIIAYKQPVTRAEIEAIRGVNVERIVRNLLERKLVKILGHKDVPGKPMVLGTTKEFLELFGLNSLAGLPPLKDFVEPPSSEGIDEEPPLPLFNEEPREAEPGAESTDDTTAPASGAIEQETEHGPELEAGDGEPEAPHDAGDPDADPDTDTNEAG
jgi:segregation and condensation protein B